MCRLSKRLSKLVETRRMSGNTRVKGSEIMRSKPGAAHDYRSKQEVSQMQGNVWKRRGKREGRERNGLRAQGCFPRPLIDLRSVYDVAFMYDAFMFSILLSHASVFTCKVSFTCKDVWHPYSFISKMTSAGTTSVAGMAGCDYCQA